MQTEQQQREIWIENNNRARAIMLGWSGMLETLRHTAASYFHHRSDGKSYERDPAHKIRILLDPEFALEICPEITKSGRSRHRTVTVQWSDIDLIMHNGSKRTLEVELRPGQAPRFGYSRSDTVDTDANRLCDLVLDFLRFPEQVIARSGDHCVFCQKNLIVPSSRLRGVGPECFRHFGDFINYLREAQQANNTDEDNESSEPDYL